MSTLINPHDTELEEVILSACMMEREAMPLIADKLRPEMCKPCIARESPSTSSP